jgi:DNA-directed RNA polymerase specialized sigma subunit
MIPREELIEAIHELADELGEPPTRKQMNEQGRYSAQPYYNTFDGWNDALRAAGFDPNHEEYDSDDLATDLTRVAMSLGHPPRIEDYKQRGSYHWVTIHRTFGSWAEALRAADLDPTERPYDGRVPREELIDELRDLTMELGRPPTAAEINEHGTYSKRPYLREFGGWDRALQEANIK